MRILLDKFKDTLSSVMPIVAIVLLLHFFVSPITSDILYRFIIGSISISIGLTIFILGIDLGISPIGNLMGSAITESNKLWLVILSGIILGVIITVAEPSLLILANQVEVVTNSIISSKIIVIVVSLGTGIMLSVGIVRIIYAVSLRYMLIVFYSIVLIASFFTSQDFLSISFDSSGATTGALAVPFILAIAIGSSSMEKDSKSAEDDSFGLVGITSIGAIIGVLFMGIYKGASNIDGVLEQTRTYGILEPFINNILPQLKEVFFILLPILIIFLLFNKIKFKLDKTNFTKICIGVVLSIIGLSLFLLGVNQGFMEVGIYLGEALAFQNKNILLAIIGFILGVVTILAEPAVHILTKQIEEVTNAYVKSWIVMLSLALGVGIAIFLAVLRIIIPGLEFWHIILPGYVIAIILSFFSPNLFVGIAFDSGGVASGPMTATFVLAFIQGAANKHMNANILTDGFGVIALVAMTPLIALQILGVVFKIKTNKISKDDILLEEDILD